MLPLPQKGEPPQLGMDGQSLLAVYPKAIYRRADQEWTLVHSGDICLPRSGPPPQVHGNMVLFRDEGSGGIRNHLAWLTLGEQPHLTSLDHDVGVVGESGPRWENSSSYCVTSSGDLWACVGDHHAASLLRRSKDGSYSIAIINNSLSFTGELLGSRETDQGLAVSAVTALPDDTLLLVGDGGLYRLKGKELIQELAFTNTRQKNLMKRSTQLVLIGRGTPTTLSCSMTNRTSSAASLAAFTCSARPMMASGASYPWMRSAVTPSFGSQE